MKGFEYMTISYLKNYIEKFNMNLLWNRVPYIDSLIQLLHTSDYFSYIISFKFFFKHRTNLKSYSDASKKI